MRFDTLIIGAGITGLHTAWRLESGGQSVRVLEARNRLGGRLTATSRESGSFDLGASWIWPHEAAVQRLVRELGLATFPQFAEGTLLYDVPAGVQAVRGGGDAGSQRVAGGTHALASAIADRLGPDTVELNTTVRRIHSDAPGADGPVSVLTEDGRAYEAARAIVALPPALAIHALEFEPSLEPKFESIARRTPVWMGAIVKTVVSYEQPFWRSNGNSGAAVSQIGPLQEIHDLSPSAGAREGGAAEGGALFGFTGLGPRDTAPSQAAVIGQLVRLFGQGAAQPTGFYQQDWSREPRTSPPGVTALQDYDLFGHPAYRTGQMKGRLHFASCETGGPDGHIESALKASEHVVRQIL